jgi:hypothetical protein
MATLNAAQRQQLALELKRFPDQAETILAGLEAKGYEIDRAEFQPINWTAEADVAGREAVKGATLGLVDPGESPLAPQAGDVNVFGTERKPAAGIGALLGMLAPAGATIKAGKAILPGASTLARGAAQEGIAGGIFGAGQTAAQAIRGEETTGEDILINMVGDAAAFAALGLIGKGVLRLFKSAAAKQAAGQALDQAEEGAVKEVTALMVIRQPQGPRGQLPPSTASGPQINIEPRVFGPRQQLPPSTASGPPIEMGVEAGRGAPPLLGGGRLGPRLQLPPMSSTGRGALPMGGPQRTLLPRLTPETEGVVGGKAPKVIQLEHTAAELYRRVENGDITSPQAMQAFQLTIERGVPRQQQALVSHRARESFRRAEGPVTTPGDRPGLSSSAGAPVTADPINPVVAEAATPPVASVAGSATPKPKAKPRPRRMPAQLTPNQVLRRGGGLRTDALERLLKDLPHERGWQRVHLGKLRGGTQDIPSLLADIRETNVHWGQVLDDAGIYTEDDLIRAVRDGSLFKKQATRPREVQADDVFAERPLDWDPSIEGFEERIPAAQSFDALEIEIQRLDDAVAAQSMTPDEVSEMSRLISERGRELTEPPVAPAAQGRPALQMQPTQPGQPPAARPVEQNMPLSLGDKRQLPGQIKTTGTAKLEGTPLDDAVTEARATAERAAAPQEGMSFSGAADVLPEGSGDILGPLKLGDSVVLMMRDGKAKIGVLSRQEAPNTISIQTKAGKIRVNANEVESAHIFSGTAGGSQDVSGPATANQVKKLYALEGDMAKMGTPERVGSDPAKLTRDQASAKIREMELRRTEIQAGNLDRMLAEADEMANARPTGRVEEGYGVKEAPGVPRGDLSAPNVDEQALRRAVAEYGPDVVKDPSFAYARYLLPEISRFGFRRNPIGSAIWDRGAKMVRDIHKEAGAFLKRTDAAMKGLSDIELFQVLKALDSEGAKVDPKLQGVTQALRQVFDELAVRLGLEPGQQIRYYFPHLFRGNLGRWRAITLGKELGPGGARRIAGQADVVDLFAGRLDVTAGVPLQKFFAHILPRYGVDGFELDLKKAVYTYVTGAVRKVHQDDYLAFTTSKMRQLPRFDAQGRPLTIRKYLAEHVAHAVGQPESARHLMAKFWADNRTFNSAVDRIVEMIGGAPEKGMLSKARRMGELNRKASIGSLTPEETIEWQQSTPADALNWIQEMVSKAQRHVDGVKAGPSAERYRAEIALSLDDFRAAMGNPFRRGVLAETAYRWMAISKLGLGVASGAVNMTQFLTNVVAKLDVRYAARGVRNMHLARRDAMMLGGRRIGKVLDDLAVLKDTPKAQEFMDRRFGLPAKLTDFAMSPMRLSEQSMRGSAGLGAYEQHLAKAGVKTGQAASEAQHQAAVRWAQELVDETLFPFNTVGTPKALRSSGMRLLLMFQSYPIHQMNFSAELIADVFTNPKSGEAWGALAKHALVYASLFGVGAKVGENFWDRTQHPAMDVMDVFSGDQAPGAGQIFDLVSGPFAAALLQLAHGNFEDAASEMEPSMSRRVRTAGNLEEMVFGTLLQDRKKPRQGTRPTAPTR